MIKNQEQFNKKFGRLYALQKYRHTKSIHGKIINKYAEHLKKHIDNSMTKEEKIKYIENFVDKYEY